VWYYTAAEMRAIRLKSAEHIFLQLKKDGKLPLDAVFDPAVVELRDIKDGERFYGGFTFVSGVAETYVTKGLLITASDACHCAGKGWQSFGYFSAVVGYDQNNNLLPLEAGHSVACEGGETWGKHFTEVANIPGYDVSGRINFVDMEKAIGSTHKSLMGSARIFLDKRHVDKNMSGAIGNERAVGLALYARAHSAPSRAEVDSIVSQYGPKTKAYLARYENCELYPAYSNIIDSVKTSQGAESAMCAALKNNIRSAEPMKMLEIVVSTQRRTFNTNKAAALGWVGPVPPRTEQRLAALILKSRRYTYVKPIPATNQLEWEVGSLADPSVKRIVVMSPLEQTPPTCCAYSLTGEGIPCLHAVAVICEKHGAANLHKFIAPRLLTAAWKALYRDVEFCMPAQADIDEAVLEAKKRVLSGEALLSPKALPPPRGRPVKNAGVRKKSWFETGTSSNKKRAYTCSLCHQTGHKQAKCPLKQVFDETDEDDEDEDDEDE
jgi:hypothetical protein